MYGHGMEKFFVQKPIGRGQFGRVYSVHYRDPKLQIKFGKLAVKRQECESVIEANEFIRECFEISQLHHINLVKYYECFIDVIEDDYISLCLVMQYGGQFTLENLISVREEFTDKKKPLFNENECIEIISQLASGLTHMHKSELIHRDINPKNILVAFTDENYDHEDEEEERNDDEDEVQRNERICKEKEEKNQELLSKDLSTALYRITDFGLSKKLETENTTSSFCGTERYLAPELYLCSSYTFNVDVFSLGAISYELLTKDRKTNLALKLTTNKEFAKELREQIMDTKGFSKGLKELVVSMLETRGKNRISSSEVLERITKLKENHKINLITDIDDFPESLVPTPSETTIISDGTYDTLRIKERKDLPLPVVVTRKRVNSLPHPHSPEWKKFRNEVRNRINKKKKSEKKRKNHVPISPGAKSEHVKRFERTFGLL